MVTVITHPVTPLDHLGDPPGGPQLGGIAMRHRAAQELAEEPLALSCRKPRRPSRGASGLEALEPQRRNARSHRITELAAQPVRRAAAFND